MTQVNRLTLAHSLEMKGEGRKEERRKWTPDETRDIVSFN